MNQGIFDGADSAANGRLAQAIGLGNVDVGAICAPVHQGQEQPVFAAEFGRATEGWQMLFQGRRHGGERAQRHAGEPLEDGRL